MTLYQDSTYVSWSVLPKNLMDNSSMFTLDAYCWSDFERQNGDIITIIILKIIIYCIYYLMSFFFVSNDVLKSFDFSHSKLKKLLWVF